MSPRDLSPVKLSVIASLIGAVFVLIVSGSWVGALVCATVCVLIAVLMYDRATDEADAAAAARTGWAGATDILDRPELDALIEALSDPALIVSAGRIARANRAALALLGNHVLGQDSRIAIRHPAVTQYFASEHGDAALTGLELVGIGAPDQSWELTIAPLSPARQLILLIDQSARHAAERMRVDFVANASHELRTPLAGILGFIETLNDSEAGADPATRTRFLSIMEGEARRMQRLVDDLISLSRIEADKFRAPDEMVDLAGLVLETAGVFHASPTPRTQDIVLDLNQSNPPLRGDRAQLSQLIHNLVSNALKYGRPGTPVTVTVQRGEGDTIRFAVTDEGDGIAPQFLPRLTERFYRVDSSRSRAMGGTGLGLAIVKHIVERHRGRLNIESALGRGTTVSVVLPVLP